MNNENFTYLYYKAFADRYEDKIYSILGGGSTTPSQKKRAELRKKRKKKK